MKRTIITSLMLLPLGLPIFASNAKQCTEVLDSAPRSALHFNLNSSLDETRQSVKNLREKILSIRKSARGHLTSTSLVELNDILLGLKYAAEDPLFFDSMQRAEKTAITALLEDPNVVSQVLKFLPRENLKTPDGTPTRIDENTVIVKNIIYLIRVLRTYLGMSVRFDWHLIHHLDSERELDLLNLRFASPPVSFLAGRNEDELAHELFTTQKPQENPSHKPEGRSKGSQDQDDDLDIFSFDNSMAPWNLFSETEIRSLVSTLNQAVFSHQITATEAASIYIKSIKNKRPEALTANEKKVLINILTPRSSKLPLIDVLILLGLRIVNLNEGDFHANGATISTITFTLSNEAGEYLQVVQSTRPLKKGESIKDDENLVQGIPLLRRFILSGPTKLLTHIQLTGLTGFRGRIVYNIAFAAASQ